MKRTILALVTALCVALGQCNSAQAEMSRTSRYALWSAAAVAVAGASWLAYRKFIKPYFAGGADNDVSRDADEHAVDVDPDDARSELGDDSLMPDLVLEQDGQQQQAPAVGIADVVALRAQEHRRRRMTAQRVSNLRTQVPTQSPQEDTHMSMWSGLDLDEDEEKSPEPDEAVSVAVQEPQSALSEAERRIFEDVKRRHRIFFPTAQQTRDELMAFSKYYHSLATSCEKVFSREQNEDEVLDFSRRFKAFRRQVGGQRHLTRFERCYSEFRACNENTERPTIQQLRGLDRLFVRFKRNIGRAPQGDELFLFHRYHEIHRRYPHNEIDLVTFIADQR